MSLFLPLLHIWSSLQTVVSCLFGFFFSLKRPTTTSVNICHDIKERPCTLADTCPLLEFLREVPLISSITSPRWTNLSTSAWPPGIRSRTKTRPLRYLSDGEGGSGRRWKEVGGTGFSRVLTECGKKELWKGGGGGYKPQHQPYLPAGDDIIRLAYLKTCRKKKRLVCYLLLSRAIIILLQWCQLQNHNLFFYR